MKTRIQEIQDKQCLAFAGSMMSLFFLMTAAGIGVLATQAKDWWTAVPVFLLALLLILPVRRLGKRFLRLGEEVERLQMQRF